MSMFKWGSYNAADTAVTGAALNALANTSYAYGAEIDNSAAGYEVADLILELSSAVTSVAPAFDWARINALAATTPSGTAATAPTPQDEAIAAAVECLATLRLYSGKTIQTSDPATWATIEGIAGALVQAGAMSAASLAAWAAMRTVVGPVWSPPVTVGDLQNAGNC